MREKSKVLNFRENAPWDVDAENVFQKISFDLANLEIINTIHPFNESLIRINQNIGYDYFRDFVATIKNRFSTVQVFHGCRITDENSYLSKGIRLPDLDLYFELARLKWPSNHYPKLTDQALVSIIKKAINSFPGNIGKICLLIDERHFGSQISSFPQLGSEFLYTLERELEKHYPQINFGTSPGKVGQPSIICVNIPLVDNESITNAILEQFFRWMIFATSKDFNVDETNPWTLNYRKAIPADWITIKNFSR